MAYQFFHPDGREDQDYFECGSRCRRYSVAIESLRYISVLRKGYCLGFVERNLSYVFILVVDNVLYSSYHVCHYI